ncbi:MAG TPA: T9SS type A sorting domain-containing protein [Ignavibacteria bacterium]|nr:T9SS type A sorting domain-containing protein [Ignavibacteria bacterium]
MKKVFILLVISFLTYPVFSQNQWVEQTNGIDKSYLRYSPIDASDGHNVVIGGWYKKIFTTTNSGSNWTMIEYGDTANSPIEKTIDVSIIDKYHIWLGTDNGKIINTSDGGTTWQLQFYDTTITNFINYIKMFDLQNGVAMGNGKSNAGPAIILKTANGGKNWNSVNTQAFGGYSGDMWRRIDFVNPNIGYFFESGVNPQKLYKTVDGGVHWDTTNFSQVSSYLTILKFYNENIGFAYTFGKILYTLDGGNSWDNLTINDDQWGMDIAYIKKGNSFTVALATIASNIYFSSDTGKTWTSDTTFRNSAIYSISFPNDQNGWVLTGAGGVINKIYYNGNGLITAIDNKNILPNNYSISQNYPNPFNPSTIIQYSLPFESYVSIVVYNILGEEVTKLVDGNMPAGLHKIRFDGSGLSSGIYFYSIRTTSSENNKNFLKVQKMVLLK